MLLSRILVALGVTILSPAAAESPLPSNSNALKALAENGDARAQLEYGKLLEDGSPDEAFKWLQKAGESGQGEGWFRIAYSLGRGTQYYEMAAELGYAEAFGYALDDLLFRAGPDADVVRAKRIADLARKFNLKQGYGAGELSRGLNTVDLCFAAGTVDIPSTDKPSESEASLFRSADRKCIDYHEGLGVTQSDAAYRKCLLSTEDADNNELAEVYANGWGVPRNPKLAIALVCHGSSVPAELKGMVQTLDANRVLSALPQPFLFCTHVTSGMNAGRCAARAEYVVNFRRSAAVAAIAATWRDRDRQLFDRAQATYEQYVITHSAEELDMSGTARGAIATEEESLLREEFAAAIRDFEGRRFPGIDDASNADAELNRVYQRLMKAPRFEEYVTQDKGGVRDTQRNWLVFRDRFTEFALARYPSVKKEVWLTWLTRNRTAQLNVVAEMVLPNGVQ
jgi:hypothetical protein